MSCVRNVRIYAFLERKLFVSAQVVALPVACAVASLAPVFLHVVSVDDELVRRAFIEACEVAAEHHEVCTHCECERDVVVMHNAAVRADWNINARLCVIFIACLCNFNRSSRLSASNALLFASDAD